MLSIGPDRNEAVKIRAQNSRMPVMKAGEDVFVGVSEGISNPSEIIAIEGETASRNG